MVADAKRMPAKSTLNGALDLLKTLVVGCAVLWLLVVRASFVCVPTGVNGFEME